MKAGLTFCVWLILLLSSTATGAQAADCLPVRVRNPEGNYIVPGVQGDIVYRQIGGRELALDAYVQKQGSRRPVVIVIHGGGWTAGSRIAYVGQMLEVLTRAGFNWFSVDYRLGGLERYTEALDDLRAALAFIRCQADRFRIDPERIALLGEDAGAHLAALLAAERPAGVKAAVLIGGFYDLRELASLKGTAADALAQASPITRITSGMPATLVIHGAADREVPPQQAGRYCEAIRGLGGRCEYLPVDNAIHRAENWWPEQWGYKGLVTAWLAKELGLAKPGHEPYVTNLKKEIIYHPRHKLKLDAYIPPGRGPHRGVILVHGGGWEAGDKVTYITPLFEPLARAGFAWFSIDYRLTPRFSHEDQLEDVRAAVHFVRDHARQFRIAPDRIAVLGESASGQMVAQIATEKSSASRAVAAVVSFYGVYDFLPMVTDALPRSLLVRLFGITILDDYARAVLRRYSPLYHVRKEMPPILLIHGTNERLWSQGVAMDKKLTEVGAKHTLYTVENAPHGMENWEGHPGWMPYKRKLIDWLRAHLARY
jgi:alpha-L-fucosidase 2